MRIIKYVSKPSTILHFIGWLTLLVRMRWVIVNHELRGAMKWNLTKSERKNKIDNSEMKFDLANLKSEVTDLVNKIDNTATKSDIAGLKSTLSKQASRILTI